MGPREAPGASEHAPQSHHQTRHFRPRLAETEAAPPGASRRGGRGAAAGNIAGPPAAPSSGGDPGTRGHLLRLFLSIKNRKRDIGKKESETFPSFLSRPSIRLCERIDVKRRKKTISCVKSDPCRLGTSLLVRSSVSDPRRPFFSVLVCPTV